MGVAGGARRGRPRAHPRARGRGAQSRRSRRGRRRRDREARRGARTPRAPRGCARPRDRTPRGRTRSHDGARRRDERKSRCFETRTIGAGRRARRPPRGCRRRRWSATSTRSACGGAVRSRAAKCSRRRCGGRWSLNRSHAPPGSAFWMRSRLVGAVQSSREIWIFLKRRWRWRASDRLGSPDLASTLVARTIRASIRHHG